MSEKNDSRTLADIAKQIEGAKLPPVHSWNPAHEDSIDISIKTDGSWHYQGSPISRAPIVKLFSGILRRDNLENHFPQWYCTGEVQKGNTAGAGYSLVTPAEKLSIHVEDAPFVGVSIELFEAVDSARRTLMITTNIGDQVIVDENHPVHVHYDSDEADPRPYVLVRDDLPALLSRAVWHQLVDLAAEYGELKNGQFGLLSAGTFIALGTAV